MRKLVYKKILYFLLLATPLLQYGCKEEEQDIALESFTLNTSDILIGVDEIQSVVAVASPDDMTDKLKWESANPEIAQVQSNEPGLVSGIIGLKVGTTTITASTADGKVKQSLPVRVIVKVTGIKLSPEVPIAPGKIRYDVLFTPADASIQDLTWTSSDPEIASVDNGVVTALSRGSSIITATTVEGGRSASVEVFVSGNPPVFGKEYCTITGYGEYCPDEVRTEGAAQNLSHVNTAIPTNNYKYYPEDRLIVKRGSDFTLHLVQSNNWSCSAVWIDWNGDRNFTNDGERIAVFGEFEGTNNGPYSISVHVPADAALDVVRMRAATVDSWGVDLSVFEPCGSVRFGTVKDFDVEITD